MKLELCYKYTFLVTKSTKLFPDTSVFIPKSWSQSINPKIRDWSYF